MDDCFNKIKIAVNSPGRKYIYAYWDGFDRTAHKEGVYSNSTKKQFKDIDNNVRKLSEYLNKKKTLLIITADHGMIDTPKERTIMLSNHPKLAECLTTCLSGESRCAYCYIRPDKLKQFKEYVKKNLKKECYLVKSEDLIKRNFYGLYTPHPKLSERIGDYTLIAKENYCIRDALLGQKEKIQQGNHGGISKEEMYVPLILIRSK